MTPLLTYKHRIVAGIANMVVELHGKRLALLLEAIKPAAHCCSPPTGQRLLANELSTRYALAQRRWESNCSSTLADSRSDYQVALAAMRASGAEALLIGSAHRVPFTPRRRSKRPRRRHHFSTQRLTPHLRPHLAGAKVSRCHSRDRQWSDTKRQFFAGEGPWSETILLSYS